MAKNNRKRWAYVEEVLPFYMRWKWTICLTAFMCAWISWAIHEVIVGNISPGIFL